MANPVMKGRYSRIVFSVLLLILLVLGGERLYLRHVENNWSTIRLEEQQKAVDVLKAEFEFFQRQTLDTALRISQIPILTSALSAGNDSASIRCFEILGSLNLPDVSVEVYNSRRQLVAWGGDQRVTIDSSMLRGNVFSFVDQGPIYSHFVVAAPIGSSGGNQPAKGYVVAERLFNVNYPISNRFINNSVFASTFTSRLENSPRFDFSDDAGPEASDQVFSVELRGLNGKTIGFAYLNTPLLSTRLDEIRRVADRIANVLVLALAVGLIVGLSRAVNFKKSVPVRILFWTCGIWFGRFVMAATDFPGGYINSAIVDPSYFASSFGFGIAKSVGDLFITSIVLFFNVIVIAVLAARSAPWNNVVPPGRRMILLLSVLTLPVVLSLFLRGFSSAVHSAVFDSTLRYNDPMFVLPPLVLSIMLLSLLLIAGSLVMAGILIFYGSHRFVQRLAGWQNHPWIAVVIAAGLFFVESYLFGLLHPSPLLGQGERALYFAGAVVVWWLCADKTISSLRLTSPRAIIAILAASIVALVPQLDREAHLLDRAHVELVAGEIVRPADSWLSFVLNRALDGLASAESADILQNGEPQDIRKLAFTEWAKSILSQEGYNCSVVFVNGQGDEVSDFHLGGYTRSVGEKHIEHLDSSRVMRVEERSSSGGMVNWYVGYAPVFAPDGKMIGAVMVELSADRQALLRGETPEILRNYTRENFETHHRPLLLSEYYQGRLASTTGENISLGRPLPERVQEQAEGNPGLWLEESVDGKDYETYFTCPGDSRPGDSWIALSMETLDVRWHLFTITRLVLFYVCCALFCIALVLGIQRLRGKQLTIDFRTKLLTAFFGISVIPIAILAYYNRQYSIERAEVVATRLLREETGVVVNTLQKQIGVNAPFDLSRLTNGECEDIAGGLGTDFNIYAEGTLLASSKPELFSAELLSPRLTSDAFLNVVLRKKAFFAEPQSIGSLLYIAGYRPIITETGSIIGLVSVPGLYRQQDVDESIMQRNAFLFGAYAVALLISFLVGTISANQISSPLRRLQQAMRQIAAGDLRVNLRSGRSDEFGDLERAFERMTHELKQAQEEMIRAQRELAWKEMAKQVAHEIKNPLTPMKLSIQHLRQAHKDRVEDFESLFHRISETLLEQIETLDRIASEFSHFARMPERKVEVCSVHEILRETVNLFQQYRSVVFEMELRAESAEVSADREELRRAFINILQNAVQAMNERGTISIKTKSVDDEFELRIADTGAGIPEDVRNRLFEPNFSTKTDGMGIGLAIVKSTIDEMGGRITVDSEIGKGTIVTIYLPLVKH